MTAPVVCSVGTTDPWNAAGLGLDIRVAEAFGVRSLSVVAAVSAQDARGLHALHTVDAQVIAAQFTALGPVEIGAYRIGALPDAESAAAIATALGDVHVPIVYDPVLGPSGGGRFGDPGVARSLCDTLQSRVTLVTPNLAEARALARAPAAEPLAVATLLRATGVRAVLITGIARGAEIVDLLLDDSGPRTFAATRLARDVRGTGCMLACAIAASLARGVALVPAIERARAFVRTRIASAESVGGMLVMSLGS